MCLAEMEEGLEILQCDWAELERLVGDWVKHSTGLGSTTPFSSTLKMSGHILKVFPPRAASFRGCVKSSVPGYW